MKFFEGYYKNCDPEAQLVGIDQKAQCKKSLDFSSKSKLILVHDRLCCKPFLSSYNIDETEVLNQCKPKRYL